MHINRVNNTLTMLAAQDGYVHQNIVAMCHAHTLYGVALASLGKEFEPIRARYSRENVSSEYIGWSHFQAIWNQLVETQTDMFD